VANRKLGEKEAYVRKVVVLLMSAALLVASAGVALAQGAGANAELKDTSGNPVGTAQFTEAPGGVNITVSLLPGQNAAGPGEHGVHIHETGDTTPDFEAAGAHLNPTGAEHGFQNPNGPHAGDLEDIIVNEDGSASYQTVDDRVTLTGGSNALLDSDGSALVLHAGSDDQMTDPSGHSGDRVAAGVIRGSVTGETTAGESTTGREGLPKSGGIDILGLAAFSGALSLVAAIFLWWRASHS
jgi:superoxide dismutase, Cu-Zn family